MSVRSSALALGILLIACLPSSSQEQPLRAFMSDFSKMPNFLVDKGCEDFSRGNMAAEKLCVNSEQNSYDVLKPIWLEIPDSVKKQCYDQILPYYFQAPYARPDRFGYTILLNCIEPAMDANAVASQGKFRK